MRLLQYPTRNWILSTITGRGRPKRDAPPKKSKHDGSSEEEEEEPELEESEDEQPLKKGKEEKKENKKEKEPKAGGPPSVSIIKKCQLWEILFYYQMMVFDYSIEIDDRLNLVRAVVVVI